MTPLAIRFSSIVLGASFSLFSTPAFADYMCVKTENGTLKLEKAVCEPRGTLQGITFDPRIGACVRTDSSGSITVAESVPYGPSQNWVKCPSGGQVVYVPWRPGNYDYDIHPNAQLIENAKIQNLSCPSGERMQSKWYGRVGDDSETLHAPGGPSLNKTYKFNVPNDASKAQVLLSVKPDASRSPNSYTTKLKLVPYSENGVGGNILANLPHLAYYLSHSGAAHTPMIGVKWDTQSIPEFVTFGYDISSSLPAIKQNTFNNDSDNINEFGFRVSVGGGDKVIVDFVKLEWCSPLSLISGGEVLSEQATQIQLRPEATEIKLKKSKALTTETLKREEKR